MAEQGKQMFHTFKEAASAGPYDERPMLPAGVDPQLHLSRNRGPQPFHLICEKDCVLVVMSGSAKVHFATGPVRYHNVAAGDFVYVPGGMPHRIFPEGECIQYRYKAARPGLEGAAWFCGGCGGELYRHVWDTEMTLPQQGYADACRAFNNGTGLRTCETCDATHDVVDFDTSRWLEIAAEMRSGDA